MNAALPDNLDTIHADLRVGATLRPDFFLLPAKNYAALRDAPMLAHTH
ncbi:MAG: hypothetical protein WBW61_00185 [Rhodanobacteraceae bacterium]